MKNKDWEKLADKYSECRAFIEFADDHYELWVEWLCERVGFTEENVFKNKKR